VPWKLRTIWTPGIARRYGSPPVMTRLRRLRESISITCDLARRTHPAGMRSGSRDYSTPANASLALSCRQAEEDQLGSTPKSSWFKLCRLDQISIVSSEDRIILFLKRQKHRDPASSIAWSCGLIS
jgi:hypothetical protein